MAAAGALPASAFAAIHPPLPDPGLRDDRRRRAGDRSGTCRGRLISENFLFDSLSALSLMIAFYYGLTGLACAIYWRHELSAR